MIMNQDVIQVNISIRSCNYLKNSVYNIKVEASLSPSTGEDHSIDQIEFLQCN